MMPNKLQNRISSPDFRRLFALVGLLLIVVGQCLIIGPGIQSNPSKVGIWINDTLHIGITNIDNVLQGFLMLLFGGVLLAYAFRGSGIFPQEEPSFEKKSIQINKIASAWPWILFGVILFIWLLLPLSRLDYFPFSPMLWIFVLLTFTVLMGLWDLRRGVPLSPGLVRQDLLWLIILLVAGLLICTYRLQGWPDQLMLDEGIFGTTARDIAIGNFTPPIFSQGVDDFPIMGTYWQAWLMKVFGISIWGWRFGSVLAGVLSAVPLYLFVREAFNRRIAIISAIVLFTNPYFLVYSHLGYTNIQPVFIITLTLYLLYTGLRRMSSLYLFLAGCAAGLGFYTYFSGRAAFVMAVLFIFLMWLMKQLKFRESISAITLLVAGTILVTAPHIIYGFNQDRQAMGYRIFLSFFNSVAYGSAYYSNADLIKYAPIFQMGETGVFYNPKIYLVLIIRGFVQTLLAYQKPGLLWGEHYLACPLAGTIGVIFYLIGLGISLRHIKQPRVLLVVVGFFTIITFFSALNTFPPREDHMAAIVSTLAILTGFGLNAMAEAIALGNSRLRNAILPILLAAIMAGGIFDYYVTGPRNFPQRPTDIISWAGLNSNGESFIYIYQDPSQSIARPFVMFEFRKDIPFKTMTVDEAINGSPGFDKDVKTVIFYPPEIASKITPVLQTLWGTGLISRTFINSDGNPVLAAGMNTAFIFERDRPLINTVLDAFHQRPFVNLLLTLLILFILAACTPSVWIRSIRDHIKRMADWFHYPGQQSISKEQERFEAPEVGLLSSSLKYVPQSTGPTFKPGRFTIQAQTIGRLHEKEFAIRIHIPKIQLPKPRLRKGFELTLSFLDVPDRILLISSVFLAVAAQLMIHWQIFYIGILFYLASIAGLIIWAGQNPKLINFFTDQLHISPQAELIITFLLFLVVAFTRFYDLGYRVHGLDAGEIKWTAQSWYTDIAQINQDEFATRGQFLPVDLWIRSVFLRAFGTNFISARIESAFISLLSVVLLYFLVRVLSASKPLAWLATALYSFSFVELNSSHQALPESTLEFWLMATLFLFVIAIKEQKHWQFQLSGVLAALGIFIYDDFLPIPFVMLIFLLGVALFMTIKKNNAARTWTHALSLTALPILLACSILIFTHRAIQGNYFATMLESSGNSATFTGWMRFFFNNLGSLAATLFSRVTMPDALINWPGSFINPVILPFVVIGAVCSLWNPRRQQFALLMLWFLLNIIIAQFVFGSVYPKSLYIVLAPLMIWGAFGLWVFLAALRALYESHKFKYAIPVFALLIVAIVSSDYHIFTVSLLDPPDSQKNRELSELATRAASTVPMIFIPQMSNEDLENANIHLSAIGGGRPGLDIENLDYGQILPALWRNRQLTGIDLFLDKTSCSGGQCKDALDIVLKCYPGAALSRPGHYFDIYHFDEGSLSHPKCYQSAQPSPVIPEDGAILPSGSPVTLKWDTKAAETTGYSITLEWKGAGIYWIEAEDVFQAPGWIMNSDFVTGFNGEGLLFDEFQAKDTSYTLNLLEGGQFRLWIRSYKRVVNDQNNFIEINGKKMQFAGNDNKLNDWVWEDMGVFDLSKGPLPITLSRTYGNDPEYSVFIDTLVLTSDLTARPEKMQSWENILSTGEISSAADSYDLGHQLTPGEYRWKVHIFDGNKLIDATGARGLETDTSTFSIQP